MTERSRPRSSSRSRPDRKNVRTSRARARRPSLLLAAAAAALVAAGGWWVFARDGTDEAAGARVFASSDGGGRWEQRAFPNGKAILVAAAATDPETVYVLAEGFSMWRSADGGRTWERMS